MGKSGKRKPSGPPKPKWKRADDRDDKDSFLSVKSNPFFERYYKEQKIVPEEEWEEFLGSMRSFLPVTFRLTGSTSTAQDLNDLIKNTYIPHLSNVSFEDQPVPPPTQLSWYPDGLAWELKVQKKVIRKQPEFKKFQDFLVYETDVGNISRQEAVSMLPPLVLDVQPHHKVLDMCAAPGSKTAQLLDALSSGPQGSDAPGVVIANDSDYKRAYMLVHQSARLHSTAMMVTNLDAASFPSLRIGTTEERNRRVLMFDRILADVPCSGDGTLRKNMMIWNNWNPAVGNGLHALQVRILLRGMALLAPGGRMVYSTCSLNPVENEAVLAAALNAQQGQFKLVDISDRLPTLKRRPGMTSWLVASSKETTSTLFSTYAEYLTSLNSPTDTPAHNPSDTQKPTKKQKKQSAAGNKILAETIFPPSNAKELGLERAMRIYPHLQDTGGFFVAVLERVESMPEVSSESAKGAVEQVKSSSLKRTASNLSDVSPAAPQESKKARTEESLASTPTPLPTDAEPADETETPELDPEIAQAGNGNEEAKVSTPPKKWKEAPYTFMPQDHRHIQSLLTSLHLQPTAFESRLFVRSTDMESPRAVYVCNDLVRDVIRANDSSKMRLINCGVKVFTKQGAQTVVKGEAADKPGDGDAKEGGEDEKMVVDAVPSTVPTSNSDSVTPAAPAAAAARDLTFRFVSEGVSAVLPFVDPSAILTASVRDLRRMLEVYYPALVDFDFGGEGGEFKRQLDAIPDGGARLVRFEAGTYDGGVLTKPLILPIWISAMSLTLMSDKQYKSALCLRMYGEDFTPFGKELKAKREASTRGGGAGAGEAPVGGEEVVKEAEDTIEKDD